MISITGYDSRKQALTPKLTTNSTFNNMTNRLSIVNFSRYNKQQQPVNLKQRVEQWDVAEHKRRHGHDHKLTDKHKHEQWGQKKEGSNKEQQPDKLTETHKLKHYRQEKDRSTALKKKKEEDETQPQPQES